MPGCGLGSSGTSAIPGGPGAVGSRGWWCSVSSSTVRAACSTSGSREPRAIRAWTKPRWRWSGVHNPCRRCRPRCAKAAPSTSSRSGSRSDDHRAGSCVHGAVPRSPQAQVPGFRLRNRFRFQERPWMQGRLRIRPRTPAQSPRGHRALPAVRTLGPRGASPHGAAPPRPGSPMLRRRVRGNGRRRFQVTVGAGARQRAARAWGETAVSRLRQGGRPGDVCDGVRARRAAPGRVPAQPRIRSPLWSNKAVRCIRAPRRLPSSSISHPSSSSARSFGT